MKPFYKLASTAILLLISACGPSLWGDASSSAPEPPASTPTAATADTSTHAPEFLWIGQSVPRSLRDLAEGWELPLTDDPQAASLRLDVSESTAAQSLWIYALAAPFPTLTDDVTRDELLAFWNGSSPGPFNGSPLLMGESTLAAFTTLWGVPAQRSVQVLPAERLLDTAWGKRPSWAILPFESLEPKWKVLAVDGQSPLHKDFDLAAYPLQIKFGLQGAPEAGVFHLPDSNRDPSRLTTVVLTGVTALSRLTAYKMIVNGIDYPARDILELLRGADILHINNEVLFYNGCPDYDPKHTREKTIRLCSPTRFIEFFKHIGADVIELSGDHFADYGDRDKLMLENLQMYDENGFLYYGGGRNLQEGRRPLVIESNGNKFIFIGCNIKTIYAKAAEDFAGAASCDLAEEANQISLYREQGYLPIATFQYHEYSTAEARPAQQQDFRMMAEAGAVIVSGSQAHYAQVMEFYDGAFIHYGLGNLFFDQMGDTKTVSHIRREFIDRHVFYDGRYIGVELITTLLEDYSKPRYMTPEERAKFLTEYFEKSGW